MTEEGKFTSALGRSLPRKKIPDYTAPIRGSAHNIIVVKAPNEMFSEAIFILRDEYCCSYQLSSKELIKKAREAAECYTASVLPPLDMKKMIIIVLAILLGMETAAIFLLLL